jgi:hypothetical protein
MIADALLHMAMRPGLAWSAADSPLSHPLRNSDRSWHVRIPTLSYAPVTHPVHDKYNPAVRSSEAGIAGGAP